MVQFTINGSLSLFQQLCEWRATVQHESNHVEVKEEELNGLFMWLLLLTRCLQDLLDLADGSLLLFI